MHIPYEELIEGINNGQIEDAHFCVKSYSHYRSCHLRRKYYYSKILKKEVFDCIELCLCDDLSEYSKYAGEFKDKERVFNIKGKGKFTLKDIYKDVEFISIKYKKE